MPVFLLSFSILIIAVFANSCAAGADLHSCEADEELRHLGAQQAQELIPQDVLWNINNKDIKNKFYKNTDVFKIAAIISQAKNTDILRNKGKSVDKNQIDEYLKSLEWPFRITTLGTKPLESIATIKSVEAKYYECSANVEIAFVATLDQGYIYRSLLALDRKILRSKISDVADTDKYFSDHSEILMRSILDSNVWLVNSRKFKVFYSLNYSESTVTSIHVSKLELENILD